MFDFIWVPLLWYFAAAEMTPKPTVESSPLRAGQEATLTCTVPGVCSASAPNITWTYAGRNDSCIKGNITHIKTENLTSTAQRHRSTLIFNASAEHHGAQVTCKVSFSGGATANETKILRVSLFLRILNTSACELKSDLLTCVCISEGFPLPTVKWPLLENCTDCTVRTIVSNNTVYSTVTMKRQSNTTIECVSSNGPDEERRNLTITNVQQEDLLSELLRTIKQREVIIALSIGFLLGIIFTSFITCLAIKCRRQKMKPGRVMEDLEMMNTFAVEKDVGHAAEEEGIQDQEEAEVGAEPVGSSAPEGDVRPKEVEYSHINFSMLKTKNPTEEELTKESPETEYAEIKKETREEGEGNEGEGRETTEEMRKDVETEDCIPAEEKAEEEVALYSNVKEILDEM